MARTSVVERAADFALSFTVSTKKVVASVVFTLIVYILFITSLTLHHVTHETFTVRTTLNVLRDTQLTRDFSGKRVTSKGFQTITSLDDVKLWLKDSFVPILWDEGSKGRGMVLDANRVLGGVLLQQEKLEERTCRSEEKRPNLYGIFNASCFKDDTLSMQALSRVGPSAQTWKDKHVYWLDIEQNRSLAQMHLEQLLATGWASIAARKVSVQTAFYNAQLEVFIFFEATFEVTRPGQVISNDQVWTLPEFIYEDAALTMWIDMLLCAGLGVITVIEFLHVMDHFRAGTLCAYLFTMYRLATIAVILGGIAFMSVFFWISYQIEDLANRVGNLVENPGNETGYLPGSTWSQDWIDRHDALNELFSEMARLSKTLMWTQLGAFWYSLAMMVRLCEGFELSSQMGLVIRTIRVCIYQLTYFLIVFLIVFVNFAFAAHFLFGHILVEWSTKFYAISSAFRTIMGDLDFMAMYEIAPASTLTWFILFTICIIFVLVNQFIVIIMDAYMELQNKDQKAAEQAPELSNETKAMPENSEEDDEKEDSSHRSDSDMETQHVRKVHPTPNESTLPTHLPQQTHVSHDMGSSATEVSLKSSRLPRALERDAESPVPSEVQSIQEEQSRMHVDRLRIAATVYSPPESRKGAEHNPKEDTVQDEADSNLWSPTRGEMAVQSHTHLRNPRHLPTATARAPSQPLAIIAKATPL